jgi:hypothetical protein
VTASADLGRRYEDVTANKPRINVVTVAILLAAAGLGAIAFRATGNPAALGGFVLLGLVLMPAPRIARQWERGVVLRFGRFVGLRGPGLFWVIPFVDR